MSADKAPAEKLPLAVRKNVRDAWENKKPELQKELSDLLGTTWTIDINPLAIYPYAEENSYASNSLGDCIASYVTDAIYHIKRFVTETHGENGKAELNSVCSAHSLTLMAGTGFTYNGSMVEEGQLRLIFHPERLGTNISQAAQELAEALTSAPQPAGAPSLSFAARHAIKTDYDPKIGALLEKARKDLDNPKFEFDPGFDAVGKALKGNKDVRDDWERNLGDFTLKYFESFVDKLRYEKFGEDDMLREGLAEGVPRGVLRFRVVEKIPGYNRIIVDDGAAVIETTPAYFGTNISQAAEKLVDIL